MADTSNKGRSGNKKQLPKNAFSYSGKFSSPKISGVSKDNRHIVNYEDIKMGAMVVHFQKFNAEEDVFWQPWSKHLDENPEVKEELKISAIVYHRGEDGQTEMLNAPGSEYSRRQLLCVIGEDANTPTLREEVAKTIVDNFNDFATHDNFCYP